MKYLRQFSGSVLITLVINFATGPLKNALSILTIPIKQELRAVKDSAKTIKPTAHSGKLVFSKIKLPLLKSK